MEMVPFLEVPDLLVETGGDGLNLCIGCGTCTGLCPWNLTNTILNVRMLMRTAQLGVEPEDTGDLWRCATCGYCVDNCPREVPIIDVTRSMRAMTGSGGSQPATLRAMLASQGQNGNPWAGEADERNDWAKDLDLPDSGPADAWMLYACCIQSYDAETRRSAKALVKVLQAANFPMWLSPLDSVCCGCSVRESGAMELTERMGRDNVRHFEKAGTRQIITSSPHCYNAFVKDYPKWGGEYEVKHYSQILHTLLEKGELVPTKPVNRTVTYHDPCYLGRHNDIYEEPRQVLQSIPGLNLVEMGRNREESVCCGGGGAQIFMERDLDERFANLRVQEALETGADTLVTACPYCNSMFRDSIKSLQVDDRLRVMDIAELLLESLADANSAQPNKNT
ncbi:MAG: (Fe-S)-binding protein [Deltaproteobacteria bacterium]|nr:(Fe-S)-binding protein [Deltaproteobacteria bacterium]